MFATYIKFTNEQVEQANNTNLADFLIQQGESLKRSGREWRWERHKEITISTNQWYHQYECRGGYAIEFVKEFFNLSFPDSVKLLLGGSNMLLPSYEKPLLPPRKEFALPKANINMRRVYDYLIHKRKINSDIITYFVKCKMLYENAKYHNAIFVGFDENGIPRHAQKRGTCSTSKSFRGNVEGSNPCFSFHYTGTSNKLYIFEAPIDLLSYITLNPTDWEQNSYLALCGVTDLSLLYFLSQNENVQIAILCLDNDTIGIGAIRKLSKVLSEKGYAVTIDVSSKKDWNEELCGGTKVIL